MFRFFTIFGVPSAYVQETVVLPVATAKMPFRRSGRLSKTHKTLERRSTNTPDRLNRSRTAQNIPKHAQECLETRSETFENLRFFTIFGVPRAYLQETVLLPRSPNCRFDDPGAPRKRANLCKRRAETSCAYLRFK